MAISATRKKPVDLDLKRREFFGYMSEGVILLQGRAGTGKTIGATCIAYNLREYFGKPVILDYHATEAFGEYTYMGSKEVMAELNRLSGEINSIKKKNAGETAEKIRENLGIQMDNAVIVWDEGYRYLERRRTSDPMTLIYGYYLQIWRHYHNTVIICTPKLNYIDFRALNQATAELNCYPNFYITPTRVLGEQDPNKWVCRLKGLDTHTQETIALNVPVAKYGPMYDTWQPIALRQKMIRRVEG